MQTTIKAPISAERHVAELLAKLPSLTPPSSNQENGGGRPEMTPATILGFVLAGAERPDLLVAVDWLLIAVQFCNTKLSPADLREVVEALNASREAMNGPMAQTIAEVRARAAGGGAAEA